MLKARRRSGATAGRSAAARRCERTARRLAPKLDSNKADIAVIAKPSSGWRLRSLLDRLFVVLAVCSVPRGTRYEDSGDLSTSACDRRTLISRRAQSMSEIALGGTSTFFPGNQFRVSIRTSVIAQLA